MESSSKCCRKSLSCSGPLLSMADGGKPLCLRCVEKIDHSKLTKEKIKKWLEEAETDHIICPKCQNKVCMCYCETVVWTPLLLAEAAEEIANDHYAPSEIAKGAPVLIGDYPQIGWDADKVKFGLKEYAKHLRERAKKGDEKCKKEDEPKGCDYDECYEDKQ